MRIVRLRYKRLYVVGFGLGNLALTVALPTGSLGYASFAIATFASIAWLLAAVLIGTRIFRGDNERVESVRPWWRWTARPTAGFWLAAYFTLSAIAGISRFLPDFAVDPDFAARIWYRWVQAAVLLGIAAMYANSSIRLLRRPELLPPRVLVTAPADKPIAAALAADRIPERF